MSFHFLAHFSLERHLFFLGRCVIGNKYMYSYHSINESFRKWYNFLRLFFHDDFMIQLMTSRSIFAHKSLSNLHFSIWVTRNENEWEMIIIIINTFIMRMKRWSYGRGCINNSCFTITSSSSSHDPWGRIHIIIIPRTCLKVDHMRRLLVEHLIF